MARPPDDTTEIGYLRNVQMHDHAEGVTAVVLAGDRGTVEVLVGDDSANEYAALDEAATEHVRDCVTELTRLFAATDGDDDAVDSAAGDAGDADSAATDADNAGNAG
ncbi:MAG: hypothetical protein ABEJ79_12460 [Halolamina sp.]